MTTRFLAALLALSLCAVAAEPPEVSAADLAARLRAKQDGTSYVRLRMSGAEGGPLQLQIKSRVSRDRADVVYQVLFPKERKGEAVLLHRAGGKLSGTTFTPPGTAKPLAAAQMDEPLFGGALAYEDVIDDPFSWEEQTIAGSETIDKMPCTILESKPGKGRRSSYASVRTWVDNKRFVPLRIEKYGDGGKLLRRISTTRVLLDGSDSIPANLTVRGPSGATTELDGSRIKRGIALSDADFSAEGLREVSVPRGAPE